MKVFASLLSFFIFLIAQMNAHITSRALLKSGIQFQEVILVSLCIECHVESGL